MKPSDVDQWLVGATPSVLGVLGGSFDRAGIDGEDLGWVEGTFVPVALAGGMDGVVRGGVVSVVFGAVMIGAVEVVELSARPSASITAMTVDIARDPRCGQTLYFRGEVEMLTRNGASAGATLHDAEGALVAHATATLARRLA